MSVKRYDFDCYAFYDSARLNVQECDDGDYVLHTDYAALKEAARFALMSWSCDCKADKSEMFKRLAALVGEE